MYDARSSSSCPVFLEQSYRSAGLPLIPPMKAKPKCTRHKFHRRSPPHGAVRHQPIALKYPPKPPGIGSRPQIDQIDAPILTNAHALRPTVVQINAGNRALVNLLFRHRELQIQRPINQVGRVEEEGAGKGSGGDDGLGWRNGGRRELQRGDSGRGGDRGLRSERRGFGGGRGESEGVERRGGGIGVIGGEEDVASEGGDVGQPAEGVDVGIVREFVDLGLGRLRHG